MSTTTYLDRFLSPISDALTAEMAQAVLQIHVDDELQAYVDSLATKASLGTLTPEEAADYRSLIDAADMIAILQLQARQFLANAS